MDYTQSKIFIYDIVAQPAFECATISFNIQPTDKKEKRKTILKNLFEF